MVTVWTERGAGEEHSGGGGANSRDGYDEADGVIVRDASDM